MSSVEWCNGIEILTKHRVCILTISWSPFPSSPIYLSGITFGYQKQHSPSSAATPGGRQPVSVEKVVQKIRHFEIDNPPYSL